MSAPVVDKQRIVRLAFSTPSGTSGCDGGGPLEISWQRDDAYYGRATWAGQRTLGGVAVVDGVLTNPLAHATATAVALDGGAGGGLHDIRVELFRANPIEADDASCLRLVTAGGTPITVAATLCAERSADRDRRAGEGAARWLVG